MKDGCVAVCIRLSTARNILVAKLCLCHYFPLYFGMIGAYFTIERERFLFQLFGHHVDFAFIFPNHWAFRVLAEGSLGRVWGVQENRPQCFQSSEATRMQWVRRTKQGPDALLNPLESLPWAQSSWACDVAKAPKLSVLVGVTHPCWGFGAGDFLQDPLGRGQNELCFPTPILGRGARTSSQGISVSKNLYSAFVLRCLKSQ